MRFRSISIRVSCCVLLPLSVADAQRTPDERKQFNSFANEFSTNWENPKWRPLVAGCIRSETRAISTLIAAEEAKYGTYSTRSKLDSAKKLVAQSNQVLAVTARVNCYVKYQMLMNYFYNADVGRSIQEVEESIQLQEMKKATADWLPNRWAQIKNYMIVGGGDAFIKTGPWAINYEVMKALTRGKTSDAEIENALISSAQAQQIVLEALTLRPYVSAFNSISLDYRKNFIWVYDLAAGGREGVQKAGFDATEIASFERVLRSLFCSLPDKKSVDFRFSDFCQTP